MRFARRPCALWMAAALLATASSAHAQWKWRDANGRLNASDTPPPATVPDKDILQRPAAAQAAPRPPAGPAAASNAPAASAPEAAAAAAPATARPATVDPQLEARRRAAEQERQAKEKAEQERLTALRADNCKRARGHLAALESGQRIVRTNEKGEREVLDDKGRGDEIRRTRGVIASDCTGGG